MLFQFKLFLQNEDKSENTVKGYTQSVSGFLTWFDESKGVCFSKLQRENVREYISYLKTVKNSRPKTINTKVNALVKFNEFLIESGVQRDMVLTKKDYVKVQQQYASLAKVELKDVEKFRQMILDSGNKRNYAIVSILGYTGLRISEALNLKINDFNVITREIIVNDGKGGKTRIVFMNDKVKAALLSWLKVREKNCVDNEYLFISNRNKHLDRSTVNKIFNEYSEKLGKEITPHDLRHFFCSHAIKSGLSIHEVANQAGHQNVHTTLLYANPSKDELISKMNRL